ncbi:MAG: glycosyltransferase [Puniceicoccales bacterium]|jgi:glycosyltransferase involved in cell wall biosynthesis|nr:glycosyltransferase [Puniceicoccales bacterium]
MSGKKYCIGGYQVPSVSVVVPVYNVEKFLGECLDSLVNQTLKDIEVICVNDGSTDSCGEILNEYASRDSRIRVINKKNTGYGDSVNAGIASATADYVGIVESDDFVDDDMFADLHACIVKRGCDVVKSNFYRYFGQTKEIIALGNTLKNLDEGKISSVEAKNALLRAFPAIWANIYRKDFLIENGIQLLDTPGASYQDASFHFKVISLAKNIYTTHRPYVYYRQDNANQSTVRMDGAFFHFIEYAEIDRFLNAHPDLKKFYSAAKFERQYGTYRWCLNRISRKLRRDVFERIHCDFKNYYNSGELTDDVLKNLNKRFEKPSVMELITVPKKAWRHFEIKVSSIKRILQQVAAEKSAQDSRLT